VYLVAQGQANEPSFSGKIPATGRERRDGGGAAEDREVILRITSLYRSFRREPAVPREDRRHERVAQNEGGPEIARAVKLSLRARAGRDEHLRESNPGGRCGRSRTRHHPEGDV
jgi:hypothetical protein